jgi:hypothetical protein
MSCLSDLKLDQLLRGELAAPDEARAHIASCEKCKARLAELEASRAAFVAEKPQLPSQRPFPWTAAGVALAAAAAFVLWIGTPRNHPVERLKGGTQLAMFVAHEGHVRPAAPREQVSPGDSLQFTYSSDRSTYFAILSVDGGHKANIYFPDGGAKAQELEPAQNKALSNSVELDNVLGAEKIYGLFCEQPLELEPVRAQLEKFQALPLLDHCRVIQLSIEKK